MKGVVLAERQMRSTDLGHNRQESYTHPVPSHLCCFSYSLTFFLFAKWLTFFEVFLDVCVRNGNHMWLIGRGAWIQHGCVSVHLGKVKHKFYDMISRSCHAIYRTYI